MTIKQIISGTEAKKNGHLNEQYICDWLNLKTPGHIVDGKSKTKQDIINEKTGISYSLKSSKSKNTQCHLTSTKKWCEFFNISSDLRVWFDSFFGIPGEDVTNGQSRYHRLTKSQIDDHLNENAIIWFNQNKILIFDVIVHRGMNNTPVDYLIWFDKFTNNIDIHPIKNIRNLVYNGEWLLKETTLHFMDTNNNKLFHLQMKGSGKKYTSGYHGLMFHIYKSF